MGILRILTVPHAAIIYLSPAWKTYRISAAAMSNRRFLFVAISQGELGETSK